MISVISCTRLSLRDLEPDKQLQVIDDQHVETVLALEFTRPRRELRNRDAAGLVDEERNARHFRSDFGKLAELGFLDHAAADFFRADFRLLGKNTRCQLFRRHFEREEPDDAAVDRFHRAVGAAFAAIGLRDVVGDVRRERGFTHRRPAREDDEVGTLQAAELVVEIGKTRRRARKMAGALEGAVRHFDGVRQGRAERLEALAVFVLLGERIETALGLFDLSLRRLVDGALVGRIDHVLADDDQRSPRREIVDRAAILGGVDDRRGVGGEPAEVLRHGHIRVDRLDVLEERLDRDRRRRLAGVDQRRERLVNAPVQRIEEMIGRQKARHAVERLVVDEDCTEQRLLGFEVVRWLDGMSAVQVPRRLA